MVKPICYSLMILLLLCLSACAPAYAAANFSEAADQNSSKAFADTQPVDRALELRETVDAFYQNYLELARNQGLPAVGLIDAGWGSVAPGYLEFLHAYMDTWEVTGYDPLLGSTVVPLEISVEEPVSMVGDEASLKVTRTWARADEPGVNFSEDSMQVRLEKVDNAWLIREVIVGLPDEAPEAIVEAFYTGYAASGENQLVSKGYHQSPYLTEKWMAEVDEIIAGFEGGGYDPFLCAQDLPTEFSMATVLGDTPMFYDLLSGRASVMVETDFAGHYFTVDLLQVGDRWLIDAVHCGNTPNGVVKTFYTWYLALLTGEEFHNPIIEGDFRTSPFLSPAFIDEIDTMLNADEGLQADPILCAQNTPGAFMIEDVQVNGETAVVIVRTNMIDHRIQLELQMQAGRWLIEDVSPYSG